MSQPRVLSDTLGSLWVQGDGEPTDFGAQPQQVGEGQETLSPTHGVEMINVLKK